MKSIYTSTSNLLAFPFKQRVERLKLDKIKLGSMGLIFAFMAFLLIPTSTLDAQCTATARMRGDTGTEVVNLLVNGNIVSTHTLTTVATGYSYNNYTSGDFGVQFINDGSNNGTDRNVRVDYVVVNGTTYQENIATHSNPSCNSGEGLYCNGSLTWHDGDLPNCGSSGGGIVPPPSPTCTAGDFIWDNNISVSGCTVSADWNVGPCCNWTYTIPGPYPAGMTSGPVNINIGEAVAWDGYCNRSNTGNQTGERYKVIFKKNGATVWESPLTGNSATDDGVATGTESAFWSGPLGGAFLPNGADEIILQGGVNSVYPSSVCISYDGCNSTTEPQDWTVGCGEGEKVDVYGAGADHCNGTPAITLAIPNSSDVYQTTVEVVYKGQDPGSSVVVYDQNDNYYCLDKTNSTSWNGYVYAGLLPGNLSEINHEAITYSGDCGSNYGLQSLVAYAFSTTTEPVAQNGVYSDESGYNNIKTFNIPIQAGTSSNPRDLTVRLPITELATDGRYLTVNATAGGVDGTTTIFGPDPALNTCCLNIIEVTLTDVPSTATTVNIEVVTVNDALPGNPTLDGQSWIMAGFITIDQECVSGCDYGDAPASYGDISYSVDCGTPSYFGNSVDEDDDSQHSGMANGDDNDGQDDEDGITFSTTTIGSGDTYTITVDYTTFDGSSWVSGWIDFNKNGVFDASEKVIDDRPTGTGIQGVEESKTFTVTRTAPTITKCGDSYARFIITSDPNEGPTGLYCDEVSGCNDGEVEDYKIELAGGPNANAGLNQEICLGESTSITAVGTSGTPGYTYTWNQGLGNGASKTVSPTATTNYRVTVTDSQGCTDTDIVQVKVNPVPTLDAGVDAEICEGQTITLTTNAVGGTAPYTYNWSNGLGTGSSKAVSPTTTTTYVITVTDNKGCTDTDNVKVTVIKNVVNAGTIAGNQSLCGGYDPSNISNSASASGGSGAPIVYIWQKRDKDCGAYSAWSNISGATAAAYNPPAITKTTQYRRVAFRAICAPDYKISNIVTKEVVENFDNAGTIGNNESKCTGYDPANIVSLTDPSGGCGGTISYLWQMREFNCATGTWGSFSNIANSDAKTYNPGAITTTTRYRRLSRRANCPWQYSAEVVKEVVVNYDNGGTIASDESQCGGFNPANIASTAAPSGGCGGTAYYVWQARTQNCGNGTYSAWSTISGANALGYNPGAITVTTQYRRLSRRTNGCTPGWAYSNVITKEVVENFDQGGTIAADQSQCSGYDPALISSTVDPSGGCGGTPVYYWQERTQSCGDGTYSSWSTISGVNSLTYNPGAITVTTQYRRIGRRAAGCDPAWVYSNTVTKEVVEQYDNAGTIAADESNCSGYDPANITSTAAPSGGCGGNPVYMWQTRSQTCGGAWSSWSNIASSNALTYNPSAITETSQYRRLSKRLNGCTPGWLYSNIVTKEVVEQYDNAGTIAANESMCGGYNPANITSTAAPSGGCGGAAVYMWQTRSQPCGGTYTAWSNIASSNTLTYNPGAITETSQYRRLSKRSNGCTPGWVYSNVVTKEVTEQYSDPGVIAGEETVCGSYDPAMITSTTDPSGGCGGDPFYVWQKSEYDCGSSSYGAWANVAGANALTYNPSTISVTTKYRRVARRDEGCDPVWVISNEVVKTVVENFTDGGEIAAAESNCGAYDPAMITSAEAPSGDNCFGTVQYRWQVSEKDCDAGTWSSNSTIAGATAATYNPGSIDGTTRYRRQVRKLPCTAWSSSNYIVKTVINNYTEAGTIAANQVFCVSGDPELLTGTDPEGACFDGATQYQWQMREYINGAYTGFANIAGATAATYDPTTVSVNTQYRRRVRKESCNYINSNIVTVTIKDNPVSGITGPSTICAKEIVTFSANPVVAGATYAWTFEGGTPASATTPNVNVEWMTPGVKEIELTVTLDGCSSTYQAAINITQEVQAIAGPDLAICSGGSVTIDGGGTPGGNYTWSVESGDPTSMDNGTNSDDVTVSPLVTTTYRLTVTQNGCTRADFITVVIDVNKNPTADAGDDSAQCIDEDFIIGGAPTGTPPVDDPTAELGYIWSPASLLNDATIANPTANIDVVGDQTFEVIVYSLETGCSDTSSVTVTIEPKAKVGNYVWMDSNYDGIQDANEMGLNGVKVDLLDSDNNIVETTTTSTIGGQAGSYEFEVCKGQYRIDVDENDVDNKIVTLRDVGPNTTDSDINTNGRTAFFTLDPGENDPSWDAGFAGVIDLSLVKTVNDNNPNVGDVVTYTITVANDGPNDATGVSVEDIIPNGLSGITNISNGGSMTAGVINWSGLTVLDQGTITLTYDATVEAPGAGVSYVNVAQVTSDDQFDTDSTPDNDDGDQSEDDEDPEEITPQVADLNLVKTVNDMTPSVGDVVTFTIVVTNEGPDTATGVRVRDGLPNGYTNITNISAPGILNGPGTAINWSNRTIASGATATFTFDAEVVAPGANTDYNNIARIQLSDQFDSDSTPGNAADTDGDGNIGSQDPDDDQDPDDEDDGDDAFVVPSGTISGFVSEDTDNDDVGNDAIEGVIITLTNNDTGATQTTTTDVNGYYEFLDLDAGSYTVTEQDEAQIDPDFVDVFDGDESPEDANDAVDALNDDSIEVTLQIGEDDEDNNFVEEQLGTISGNVSEDTDNDDVANDPIAGVTITLMGPGGTQTTVTDANGDYEFTDLEPGEYTITEQDEAQIDPDFVDVFDGDESPEDADDAVDALNDDSIEVTLTPGEDDDDNNFVEEQLGTISGNVSEDTDNDDVANDPIAGVTITLMGPGGTQTTVTDANGDYEFTDLEPGEYTITEQDEAQIDPDFVDVFDGDESPEDADDAVDALNDDSIEVTLTPGEDDEDNNFVEEQLGTISGNVSEDTDNDDVANDPIAGVTITLTDVDSGATQTTVTDANGDYEFTDLEPGEYTITEQDEAQIDPDFVDVFDGDESPEDADDAVDALNDDSIEVTLTPGEDDDDNNFVEEQLGTISGNVSEDTDNDDVANDPIAGVTITLTDVDSGATQTTVTDANGDYEFTDLEPGEYTITEQDEAQIDPDFVDVFDGDESPEDADDAVDALNDDSIEVTLTPGEDDDDNNFVEEQLGTISGNVSEDTDNDDVANDPIAGVTITLTDVDSGATQTTVTDANGDYEFTDLEPGEYTITEQDEAAIDPDFVDVFDGDESPEDADDAVDALNDDSIEVTLTPGEDDEDNNFVEEQLGTISGNVSEDTDNDDVADAPIEGVTITLTDVDSGATQTTVTDANGDYEFTDLEPGEYTITEQDEAAIDPDFVDVFDGDESPEDADDAVDALNDDSIEVTLTPGEDDDDNNFVEEQLGTISGNVSEDTDNDDVADAPIEGVTITLTDVDSGATQTTVTDANGDYEFTDLEPGEYTITEQDEAQIDPDFVDVFDGDESPEDADDAVDALNDDSIEVTLTPGEDDDDNNFVEEQLGTISGNVSEDTDNDDVADAPIEGVTITLTDVDSGATQTTVTDANGDYEFTDLEPGEYTITEQDEAAIDPDFVDVFDGDESPEDADDAVDALNDDSIEVTLTPGEDDEDNNFVEEQLGTISGNVSEDTDNDDVADAPIEGVTITLTDVDSGATQTTVTDANGDYEFTDLEPGEYTITEQDEAAIDPDFVDVFDGDESPEDADDAVDALNDDSIEVTLTPGEDDEDNNFVEEQLGTISGNVSEDTDNDDVADAPIEGVTITLTDVDSGATQTTVTDANGDYEFTDLEPGEYTITEQDEAQIDPDFVDVFDGDESPEDADDAVDALNDDSIEVTLTPGEDDEDNNFVEEQLGTISGNVSEDTDNDDVADAPIEGVTITLTDVDSGATQTTVTDANGDYEFTDLEPGEYTITEQDEAAIDPDFVDVFDGDESPEDADDAVDALNDDSIEVTLTPGEDDEDNNFVEEQLGTISGNVSEDTDNDDVADAPIEGVTITLTDVDSGATQTTVTDANGDYEFTDLEPGEYTITEQDEAAIDPDFVDVFDGDESPEDADDAVDALNDDSIEVTLTPGEDDEDNNFVEEQLGTISGNVSEDTDNDDVADAPIEGVTITLTDVDSGATQTTVTDANGDYEFTDLEPGEYTITEQDEAAIDPDFVDVFDGDESPEDADDAVDALNDDSIEVTLTPGEDDEDNNFVEEQLGTITGNVSLDDDNDDLADTPQEGVTVTLTDVDSGATVTTVTDSNGDYEFTDLEPGDYTVTVGTPTDGQSVSDEDEDPDGDASDTDMTVDDSVTVTLTPGEDDVENNFVDELLGTISGNVSEDTDNDDVADAPIEGVTITLTDVDSGVTYTTVTDANGDYEFTDLEAGEYTITEQDEAAIDPDYVDVFDGDETPEDADDAVDALNDDSIEVTLAAGEDDEDNNFVEEQLGTITGNVSLDDDNDDLADTPQEGVTVTLTDVDSGATVTTVTDANGDYEFTDLEPGDYTVTVGTPTDGQSVSDEDEDPDGDASDTDMTVDDSVTVTLTPGEDDVENNFVDELLGTISGNVSEDTDNDDVADAPIEGVTITLTDVDSGVTYTTVTDANGDYEFTDLEAGEYTITEQDEAAIDPDYVDVFDGDETPEDADDAVDALNDDSIEVTLIAGEDDADNNFVEEQLGSISGTVLLDTDNDDLGDTPQEGVTVTLLDENGDVVATTTTDSNGDYIFEDVEPGDYSIVVEDPADSQSVSDEDESDDGDADDTDDTVDNTIPVTVDPGEDDDSNNFVDEELGTISGNVSEDTDNDDVADSPIEGVTITLLDDMGAVVATTTTDGNGDYEFTGVEPGDYTVVEEDEAAIDPDYVDVFDGDETSDDANDAVDALNDDIINVTVNAGEDDEDNNFVEEQLGSISGTVLLDTDNDDLGDTPQEGVTVTLLDENGDVIATTTTDSNGDYIFEDVEPGDYSIVVEDPADSQSVSDEDESDDGDADDTDDTVDNTIPVTVDPGEDDDSNNFVDEELGTISGNVSEDTDNDDVADSPIEGVTITLLDDMGAVVATTTTDGNGDYEFTGVEPGDYTVVEEDEAAIDPDYVDVFDGDETSDDANDAVDALNDDIINVTVNAGEDDADNNFVEEQLGSISGTVLLDTDNDDLGDTPQEGVTVTLLDENGDVVATTTTDSNGDYIFEDVEPGDYSIVVEDPADSQSVSDEDESDDGDADDTDDTVDNTIPVTVDPGEDDDSNNFVDEELGTISGNVSEDTDNDDVADSPIEGVTITLLDDMGAVVATTTTDGNGDYEFTGVEPGDYTVVEEDEAAIDPDYVDVFDGDETSDDANDAVDALNDDIINVTVNAGEDDEDNNFVEEQLGSISGNVSLDDDNDDLADTPQEGVTVTLLDENGDVVATTTTDSNGDYVFTGVEPGDYTVTVGTPTDAVSVSDEDEDPDGDASDTDMTVDDSIAVTLTPGEDDAENNFIDELTASLGNYVWLDENGDGIQDASEDGINDVRVELYEASDLTTIIATEMTATENGEDGYYLFEDLAPGDYVVKFVTGTDQVISVQDATGLNTDATDSNDDSDADPTTGLSHVVTLSAGEEDLRIDAGIYEPLSLGNFVWDDTNNNGVFDAGEQPIEGVTLTLFTDLNDDNTPDASTLRTEVTDANGEYLFDNLAPGDYIVVVDPSNFAAGGTLADFISSTGNDLADGTAPDADVSADDTDDNGYDNGGNIGVISKTVTLSSTEEPVSEDGDANSNLTVDFGFFAPAAIGNYVWEDADADGIQDADEVGINGVTVILFDASNDAQLATTTTMSNPDFPTEQGYYIFDNLTPGSYYVKFVNPTGFTTTAPGTTSDDRDSDANDVGNMGVGMSPTYTLMPGDRNMTVDAGYYQSAKVGNYVWLDANPTVVPGTIPNQQDEFDTALNGITVNLFDMDGGLVATQVTRTENGEDGYYMFTDLPAGQYFIQFDIPNDYSFVVPGQGDDDMDSDVTDFVNMTTQPFTVIPGACIEDIDAGVTFNVLPIELASFSAKYNDTKDVNELRWETETEINSERFEIERRHESESEFYFIDAKDAQGNSADRVEYNYADTDIDRNGDYFYRLKMIDIDGSFEYSQIRVATVERGAVVSTSIYPNPASRFINLDIESGERATVVATLLTDAGRLVRANAVNQTVEAGITNLSIELDNVPGGTYLLRVEIGSEVSFHKILIVR